jgi:hypothetical protein
MATPLKSQKIMKNVKIFNVFPGSWHTSIITPGHSPTLFDTIFTSESCFNPFWSLMNHQNRQITKSREIIERAQLSWEWSTFSKPWPQSISGYRIFLDLSLIPSEPVQIKAHLGRF